MKTLNKSILLLFVPVIFILLASSNGSPGGRTGSVGDNGQNCTGCHTGTPQNATSWITSNIPPTGYVPGQTYTITATGTHNGVVKFGFELTAENSAGAKVGTFIITNSTQTKLVNQNKAVTHLAAGTTPTGNTKTWSMNWIAPNPGAGDVTFYAALNAANGNGNNSGDVIYLTSTTVQEQALGVEVTFRVDMSNETVSPLGVHIAGNFQGWIPSASMMNPVGDNIYELTFNLTPGSTALYKFINGNTWANVEPILGPCTTGNDNNRFLLVPETNTVLPEVCFGSCNICNPPVVDVTFQVDMSQQTISPQGVFLVGTFNNWNQTANPMNPIGDNIYSLTLSLGSGDYHKYKFKNGAAWETVPGACAQGGDRFIIVPSVSSTLDAVCYGSCYPCGPPPVPVQVTFQVDMSNETVSPSGIHIAGGFQGWDPGATLMTNAGDNIYVFTTTLNSGTYQEYKFVNGTTWEQSENLPPECSNSNNRYFTVPQTNATLDLVCYGSCGPCPGPVEVNMTFLVDMSEQTVSPDGVHLVLQGGNLLLNPMVDMGNGTYSVTLTFIENDSINYKFANGATVQSYEVIPAECRVGTPFTGGYWRKVIAPSYDLTLDAVCFAECGPCDPVNVTFRVDMTNEVVSEDGVHLAGSFQGWNASNTPMTDMGNGIWEVTVVFAANQYAEFKYINGNDFAFAESVPEECGVDDTFGGFNRFFTVPQEDVVLDLVCFGSCEECVIPVEVEVTFSVDMTNEVVSPDGVFISGSFQGWISDATPMTPVGENIYTYTATLTTGDYYEFKYLNGPSFDYAEIVPEACGQNGNRFLTVPENGISLNPVCFGGCGECPVLVAVTFQVDMSLQEVSPDGVHLVGDFQGWNPETTPLTNIGDEIYTVEIILPAGTYQTYRYINGNSYETGIVENVPAECGVDDGFGGLKRFFDVPLEPTILDLVCFGYCGTCPLQHAITLPAGWSGLSSYLLPETTDIEALLSAILPELIIIQTMTEFYYPAGGTNTIENWESQSAYQIKLTDEVTLTITGQPEPNKTLQLNEGWNLIPVISDEPLAVVDLFANVANSVDLVKAVADVNVFWPAYNINTIGLLQPGKAYFVKMSAPGVIIFP
ncbi:MAG: hypothetical protein IH598_04905 [Bacteroidales bacterium]|nr:hypothetical protein [Bacteroidales bacterium]